MRSPLKSHEITTKILCFCMFSLAALAYPPACRPRPLQIQRPPAPARSPRWSVPQGWPCATEGTSLAIRVVYIRVSWDILMYSCVYISVSIYTRVYIYIYIHTYIYIHIRIYVYMHMYRYMFIYVYMCICICIDICLYTYICVYAYV